MTKKDIPRWDAEYGQVPYYARHFKKVKVPVSQIASPFMNPISEERIDELDYLDKMGHTLPPIIVDGPFEVEEEDYPEEKYPFLDGHYPELGEDVWFVRDGHHRVSLAIRRGDRFIEALLLEEERKNPARARRSEDRKIEKHSVDEFGEEWTDVDYEWIDYPPFLTEGHFDLPMVKEAARIASRAKESKQLGRGHFGEAFVVETSKGPVIVKVAAERMLYQDQRPWTRKEQQANLMHEAGVANELEDLGYTIVPSSVYVELEDGTPAIVREYGEEVAPGKLSGRAFYDLERSLFSLEEDTGWRVQDDLLLLRRPDGSLFIGDVGIWAAPDVGRQREWRSADSHLPGLLGNLGEHLFGQRFASLGRVQQLQDLLEEYDQGDAFTKMFREELEKALSSRDALGIPSPSKAYRVLEKLP